MKDNYILLKWGTLKGWNLSDPKALELLEKYHEFGVSMSAVLQHDSPEQKAVLRELILQHEGDIQNDWSGEHYTREQALEYIDNYGTPKEKVT